ncbi:MAG TPA: MBL fold metallo-hydrolase [Candidatus Acidoferrales bacterium]|nr:MBL fold metallo-hydrolase [Candidatus Acidoferrales bacterium]
MKPTGAATRPTQTFQTGHNPVKITPIYNASLLIEEGNKAIYLDPARPGNFFDLPPADLILITDIDSGHMDLRAIAKIRTPGTEIVAPPAVVKIIPIAHALANGEITTLFGWNIRAVPMYNIKRGPAPGQVYHPEGRGNGYVLTYGGMSFYISGDTGNIPEMRSLKGIDVAFVCMNPPYAMSPDEAAEAVREFRPAIVFPYDYHGSDPAVFAKDLQGTGIDVRLLDWYPKMP